jgi:mono/diheme cytochrome c family protein
MPMKRAVLAAAFALAALALGQRPAAAADIAHGKYLVSVMGCTDCHTPGHFLGKEDESRYLGGSEAGFSIPGLGVFYGPNLTSDNETGLGKWTEAQIVTALTKGETPGGRILAPAMPWRHFAGLTPDDAASIAAFLKTLPAVHNRVPGPFGPSQTPTSFVMTLMPGEAFAHLPKPPAPTPPPTASAAPAAK